MHWYIEAWKNSFVITGRARRKEYWYFLLFNWLIVFGIISSLAIFGIHVSNIESKIALFGTDIDVNWLFRIIGLILFIPNSTVLIRRLHDTNRSMLWFFVLHIFTIVYYLYIWLMSHNLLTFHNKIIFWCVFIFFSILGLIFACQDSDPGTNNYGPNPKEVDTTSA